MATANITAERLRELLQYDQCSGAFTYKVKRGTRKPGDAAGCKMIRGNIGMMLEYRRYSAHRLAWLYMTGEWPTNEVDHIDGDATNNRWNNLREANSGQNKQNQRRPRKDNKCGFLGVYRHCVDASGNIRWRARIQLDGKTTHLGLFPSPESAHEAYVKAKRILHPFGNL